MANHRVVHFEIPADEPESLSTFYAGLFDWKVTEMPGADYWMCEAGDGDGINGAITKRQDPKQGVTNYVSVDSVEESGAKAESLGGTVLLPRQAVPGMGWFAHVADPEGTVIGLWESDEAAATP